MGAAPVATASPDHFQGGHHRLAECCAPFPGPEMSRHRLRSSEQWSGRRFSSTARFGACARFGLAQLQDPAEPCEREQGAEPGSMGPEALAEFIAAEHARYGRMIREAGIKAE